MTANHSPIRITDCHIHIQPWRQLKPAVMETMRRGKEDRFEFLLSLMDDPKLLLRIMDEEGIDRVGMVNYPSPDLMGFTNDTNDFAARYAEADPRRPPTVREGSRRRGASPGRSRRSDAQDSSESPVFSRQCVHRRARHTGHALQGVRGSRAAGDDSHRDEHLSRGAKQMGEPDGNG